MAKEVEEIMGDVFFQHLVEQSKETSQDDPPKAQVYATLAVALAIKDMAEAMRSNCRPIRPPVRENW